MSRTEDRVQEVADAHSLIHCPMCRGKARCDCDICMGRGWIPHPREAKKLIQAMGKEILAWRERQAAEQDFTMSFDPDDMDAPNPGDRQLAGKLHDAIERVLAARSEVNKLKSLDRITR